MNLSACSPSGIVAITWSEVDEFANTNLSALNLRDKNALESSPTLENVNSIVESPLNNFEMNPFLGSTYSNLTFFNL